MRASFKTWDPSSGYQLFWYPETMPDIRGWNFESGTSNESAKNFGTSNERDWNFEFWIWNFEWTKFQKFWNFEYSKFQFLNFGRWLYPRKNFECSKFLRGTFFGTSNVRSSNFFGTSNAWKFNESWVIRSSKIFRTSKENFGTSKFEFGPSKLRSSNPLCQALMYRCNT